MNIPARTLRMTFVAAALAAAAGGAFALDTGGFMRVATDTTMGVSPNSAPGMPGRAEGDRDQQPAATTDMSADKAKQSVSDSTVTSKVKAKLLVTKELKSTGIHVKTKNGTVNLSGSVPTQEQHQLAVDATRSVNGVSSVNDELKVLSQ
ncbi:transport-associated protein [Cupriavidus basilensis OR16]|uniref:Transport-associated protein n=1 Tax=Cupriavidus basilensis OR16 TaxID=1127483 RepID=H1SBP2_9BURK|nr:BON domain-containing protein [Cupriavidus basilensis]EHP40034.1 transport-associated protein [Cupriavidus basilensis OR16]